MGIATITGNIIVDSGAGIGTANGVATLDGSGKVPVTQLPNSVMEFKGMWDASTNTPTLVNGTGNAGDVYEVSVGGTVDFGAGSITFNAGDYVIYDGSQWQYSSGQRGNIVGTFLTGQIPYATGATALAGSNNLLWDSVTNRFTVGGSAYISGTSYFSSASGITSYSGFSTLNIVNDGPASIAIDRFSNNATAPHFNLRKSRGTVAAPVIVNVNDELGYVGFWGHDGTSFQRNGIILVQAANVTGTTITPVMRFGVGTSAGTNQYYISLFNTGNTLLGPSATADGGQRLQVIGETLLRGSGNAAATTALSVQNSDSSNMLQILNNGYIRLGNLGNASFRIYPSTVASGGDVDLNGEFLTLNSRSLNTDTGSAAGFIHINGVSATPTSGIQNVVSIQKGFAPTGGNAVHTSLLVNPLINQGGGANGVTRGLYVNPTLTSAADFRAIQWDNNTGLGLYGAGTAPNLLNGRLYIPAGSYDLPSLSFANDTNTGLFSPLADNLEIKTGTNNAVILENQGTNIMQYSEALGAFPTNTQQISVSIPGGVAAPDGTLSANIAVPDTSLNQHRFYRIYSTASPFTMSVYAKAAGYNFISLAWSGGINGEAIIFDLVNGTISGSAATHTATIENVGNGWFRCSITYTGTGASSSFSRWIIVRNANSTASYSGDGTSGVYVWGWQIEESTASTSYIRTGATAITRPQSVTVLGQNLYGNLTTRKIGGPSLNDFALTTDYTDRLIIKSTTGNVLVGTASDSGEKFQVTGTMKVTGASVIETSLGIGSGASTGYNFVVSKNITGSVESGAIRQYGSVLADVSTVGIGIRNQLNVGAGVALNSYQHYRADVFSFGAGATLATQIGFIAENTLTNATNNYGFYGNIAAATGRWNLYMAGTAENYLAGNLGIGALGLAETTFFLNKNITGGTTAWAMRSQGTIQSDVTSGRYFVTLASTQAAVFTVSTIFHYLASATTFGAGSTVTEQYGFHAASQLTGATNNYGFFGNIASGTGRWNIYMAGTAANYLAGVLQLGSATALSPNEILQVTGNGIITGSLGFGTDGNRATILASGTNSRGILIQDNASGTANYSTLNIGNGTKTASGRPDLELSSNYNYTAIPTAGSSKLLLTGTYTEAVGGAEMHGIYINTTIGTTNNYRAIQWTNNNGWGLYGSGTASNYLRGSLAVGGTNVFATIHAQANTFSGTNQTILFSQVSIVNAITNLYAIRSNILGSGAATATNAYHYSLRQSTLGSSAITNQYGYYSEDLTGATNNYGFYGDVTAATGRWNIYMAGTAANYLNGNTIIGTLASDSGENLQLNGTMKVTGLSTITNATNSATHLQIGGAVGNIGDAATPAIKFGNTNTGIYTDTNRVFFTASGTFCGGFAAGLLIGSQAWVNTGSGADNINTPKFGAYRTVAAGLAGGLGGNSAGDISIITNSLARLTVAFSGDATFSSSVTSTQFRLSALNTAPATASSTGTLGEIRIDADYIYICTATNTWKRVAIATW